MAPREYGRARGGADKRTFHSITQIVCININFVLVHVHRGVPSTSTKHIKTSASFYLYTKTYGALTGAAIHNFVFVSVLLDAA